jgi:hypothetical protein
MDMGTAKHLFSPPRTLKARHSWVGPWVGQSEAETELRVIAPETRAFDRNRRQGELFSRIPY